MHVGMTGQFSGNNEIRQHCFLLLLCFSMPSSASFPTCSVILQLEPVTVWSALWPKTAFNSTCATSHMDCIDQSNTGREFKPIVMPDIHPNTSVIEIEEYTSIPFAFLFLFLRFSQHSLRTKQNHAICSSNSSPILQLQKGFRLIAAILERSQASRKQTE